MRYRDWCRHFPQISGGLDARRKGIWDEIRVGCGGIGIRLGMFKALRSNINYVDINKSCTGKLRYRVPHMADRCMLGKKEEESSARGRGYEGVVETEGPGGVRRNWIVQG